MTCIERNRLQDLTASIHHELEEHILSPVRAEPDEGLIPSPVERAMRTALFSSQIDLAFHQAKCLVCLARDGSSDSATDELRSLKAA